MQTCSNLVEDVHIYEQDVFPCGNFICKIERLLTDRCQIYQFSGNCTPCTLHECQPDQITFIDSIINCPHYFCETKMMISNLDIGLISICGTLAMLWILTAALLCWTVKKSKVIYSSTSPSKSFQKSRSLMKYFPIKKDIWRQRAFCKFSFMSSSVIFLQASSKSIFMPNNINLKFVSKMNELFAYGPNHLPIHQRTLNILSE